MALWTAVEVVRWVGSRKWHVIARRIAVNHVATVCKRAFIGTGESLEYAYEVSPDDVDLCAKCDRASRDDLAATHDESEGV